MVAAPSCPRALRGQLATEYDDVVDRDVDELGEGAGEAYEEEADAGGAGDVGELCGGAMAGRGGRLEGGLRARALAAGVPCAAGGRTLAVWLCVFLDDLGGLGGEVLERVNDSGLELATWVQSQPHPRRPSLQGTLVFLRAVSRICVSAMAAGAHS